MTIPTWLQPLKTTRQDIMVFAPERMKSLEMFWSNTAYKKLMRNSQDLVTQLRISTASNPQIGFCPLLSSRFFKTCVSSISFVLDFCTELKSRWNVAYKIDAVKIADDIWFSAIIRAITEHFFTVISVRSASSECEYDMKINCKPKYANCAGALLVLLHIFASLGLKQNSLPQSLSFRRLLCHRCCLQLHPFQVYHENRIVRIPQSTQLSQTLHHRFLLSYFHLGKYSVYTSKWIISKGRSHD